MTHVINRHARVARDIVDLADYIARDSPRAAFEFIQNVEATISSLTEMPGRGSPKRIRHKRLKNVRSFAVKKFPNHLILYEIKGSKVFVLAVVHGARNYPRLLRDRVE